VAAAPPAEPAPAWPDPPRRIGRRWWGTAAQITLALLCWLGLGLLVYATDPDDALPRVAFFFLLFGALAFSLMPIVRALTLHFSHSRIFQERSGIIAARQSVMFAAFVVLNALLQMLRAWTGLIALLLLGMFAVIEVVALARR
jgi:hypothetical protein